MAERSSVLQGIQVGKEVTYGTDVAANKRLLSVMMDWGPRAEVTKYRGGGVRFDSVAALNKEWAEATLSGPITYTDLTYLLASLIKDVSPTGTTDKTWVFSPSPAAADTVASYTVEQGGSVRAHQTTGVLVTGLTLDFTRDGATLSGTAIGQALTDAITMTSTPTDIALVPVMPTQVSVKTAATQAGLAGASALTRVLSASWQYADVQAPLWALTGTATYPAMVPTVPTLRNTLRMEADAAGMAYLTNLRAGSSIFTRITATGAVIGAGPATYSLQIDTACKVTDVTPFEDDDGVFAIEWTLDGVVDPTWTKATEVTLVNELASL